MSTTVYGSAIVALVAAVMSGCGQAGGAEPGVDTACFFSAGVQGGPAGQSFAGPHQGPAHTLGNALVLKDPASGWTAQVGVPEWQVGEVAEAEFRAAAVSTGGGSVLESWDGVARVVIESVVDGTVTGSLTGTASPPASVSAEPVSVDVEAFRAVPFGVRASSAYKQCVSEWESR